MSGIITDNLGRSSGLLKSAGGGTVLKKSTLQVVDDYSHSGTSPVVMTEFNLSFQPTTATGKLLFEAHILCSAGAGDTTGYYFYNTTDSEIVGVIGAAEGSRLRLQWAGCPDDSAFKQTNSMAVWYEPNSTDNKAYTIYGAAQSSNALAINRNQDNADAADIRAARGISTFTITEYAASVVTIS